MVYEEADRCSKSTLGLGIACECSRGLGRRLVSQDDDDSTRLGEVMWESIRWQSSSSGTYQDPGQQNICFDAYGKRVAGDDITSGG
jgi:hypothetical protein